MTISEQSSRMIFDGNGVTTAFDFDRPFFDENELVVAVYDSTVPEIVELDPSAYTVVVTGTFPNNTATITYPLIGPPLTVDEQLIIYRMSPQEQSTNISNQSAYFLSSIETRLDQNMLMTQELQDQAHRALKSPLSTPVDIDMVLPVPVDLGVLMWSDTEPYTIIAQPKDEFVIDVSGVEDMIDTAIADFAASPEYLAAWQASWDVVTSDTVTMDSIEFDQTPAGTPGERVIMWNDEDGTLDIGLTGGNVTLQTGQETLIRVANQTGSLIADGTPVVYVGANPARIRIAPAIADGTYDPALVLGVTTEDIAHGSEGFVTVRGAIRHLNTSGGPVGETWVDGDIVYISATTAGALTKVSPQAPDISIPVAVVLHASVGNGQLYVVPPHVKALRDLTDVNGTPLTENGQLIVWDNDNGYFDFTRNANDYDQAYTAVVVSNDCTGFSDPDNVAMTYDSSTRTITITSLGTGSIYFNGAEISMSLPWTSDAHTAATGRYFLQHDGTDFLWASSANFKNIMIAWVNYGATDRFALRECHGLMDWESHRNLHNNIGAYRTSGGILSSYILNDTANRQPLVSAAVVYDEDLPTTLAAITTTTDYTQAYLTGAGSATTFVTVQSSIVPVSGNQPYWNEYTGGAWTQTLMSAGYMSVWFIGIPVTGDATSQRYRYVWIQGQSISADTADGLAAQDSLTFGSLELGDLATLITEFVAIAKVVIRYTSGNWSIAKVTALSGSRNIQSTFPVLDWLLVSSINDTPVDGVTDAPISSNWAYDHVASSDPHSVYMLESNASTEIGASTYPIRTSLNALKSSRNIFTQGSPTLKTASVTLTASEIASFLIRVEPVSGAVTLTLPTASDMAAYFTDISNDEAITFSVWNNTSTIGYNVSIALGTGWATAGSIILRRNESAFYQARRTSSTTWVLSPISATYLPASLILADLLTVDGASSGLDADLLDGQHGSYYATDSLAVHLAGDETITGAKTFTSNILLDSASSANFSLDCGAVTNLDRIFFNVAGASAGLISYNPDTVLANDTLTFYVGGTSNSVLVMGASSLTTPFRINSTLATGTSPFSVTSTTLNTNLNADLLDGQHGSYYAMVYKAQATPTAKTASTTLTGAEWATKIITANGAAGAITLQLPTAADMDTAFPSVSTGYCAEEVSVINISTTNNYTATITTNTGWTLVGDMVIIENDTAGNRSSGKFLARKTGTAAWTLYRTT